MMQEAYDFSKNKYRGQAVVIVNKHFYQNGQEEIYAKRLGSGVDRKNMRDMFKLLDFKVLVYKDLEAEQMKEKIRQACEMKENQESDCFVVVISTHGQEAKDDSIKSHLAQGATVWKQSLLGSDCKWVLTEDIIDIVNKESNLKHKPKLFFLQACRSRHPFNAKERFDEGKDIMVVLPKSSSGVQPSDASDQFEGVADLMDGLSISDIEDVNQDWTTEDPDEWNGDTASDEEDFPLNDGIDFADAKREEENTCMTSDRPLTTPSDIAAGDSPATVPVAPSEQGRTQDAGAHLGDASPITPDQTDAGHSQDTGSRPPEPFDIIGVTNLPNDCLLVYPVMFGRVAFRKERIGSRMLHLMQIKANLKILLNGGNILQYLTAVSKSLATADIRAIVNKKTEETKEVKVNICVQHRLLGNVCFSEKKNNSYLGKLKKKLLRN